MSGQAVGHTRPQALTAALTIQGRVGRDKILLFGFDLISLLILLWPAGWLCVPVPAAALH